MSKIQARRPRPGRDEPSDDELSDDGSSSSSVGSSAGGRLPAPTGGEPKDDGRYVAIGRPREPLDENPTKRVTRRPSRTASSLVDSERRTSRAVALPDAAAFKPPPLPPALPPHRKLHKQAKQDSIDTQSLFRCSQLTLQRVMWWYGSIVTTYTYILMLIPLLLFCLSIGGLFLRGNQLDFRPNLKLFSVGEAVTSSSGSHQQDETSAEVVHFNRSQGAYNAICRTSAADFAVLLETAGQTSADTILTEEFIDEYLAVKRQLDTTVVSLEQTKKKGGTAATLAYEELCRPLCPKESVVGRLLRSELAVPLTYPETILPPQRKADGRSSAGTAQRNQTKLFIGNTFGGVDMDPNGAVARAKSLALYYRLKSWLSQSLFASWDVEFQKNVGLASRQLANRTGGALRLSWWSRESLLGDASAAAKLNWHHVVGSSLLLLLLVLLASFAENSYKSKPFVGLALFVSVALAILGGLAVEAAVAGTFNVFLYPVVYVLIGVGALCGFSLVESWRKLTNVSCHPRERFLLLCSWDGPAVVATILCQLVCCAVGWLLSKQPLTGSFFRATAAALFLLLVFLLAFLLILVYVSGRRELAGLKWFNCWSNGDKQFPVVLTNRYHPNDVRLLHKKLYDLSGPSLSRRLGSIFSSAGQARYAALLLFIVYGIFAVWGCLNCTVSLKEEDFLSTRVGTGAQSQTMDFLTAYRRYYGRYDEYVELIFDDILDYMNSRTRDDIFSLLHWAKEEQFVTRVVSWLREFESFEQSSIYLVNEDTFVPVVNLVFLNNEPYRRYRSDIAFDRYHSQILKSRMYLELSHKGILNRLTLARKLQSLAKVRGLPLRVKMPFVMFLYHDLHIVGSLVMAVCALAVCVALCSLLIFGQPLISCLLMVLCFSAIAGCLGYSQLAFGLPLNAFTAASWVVQLLIPVGQALFVCHHFLNAGPLQQSAGQRIQYVAQSMFYSTLMAFVLPPLLAAPLLLSANPMVMHLVQSLVVGSLVNLLHGLLFLPAALQTLAQYAPRLCRQASNHCCDAADDQDSGSIYYIPTTGRSLDPDTLRRYLGSRYGDGVSVSGMGVRALPPPPLPQAMLMAPPSRVEQFMALPRQADLLAYRPQICYPTGQQTPQAYIAVPSSVAGHVTSNSDTDRDDGRLSSRRRDTPERDQRGYRVPNWSPVSSKASRERRRETSRRGEGFVIQPAEEDKSAEENIYQEPSCSGGSPCESTSLERPEGGGGGGVGGGGGESDGRQRAAKQRERRRRAARRRSRLAEEEEALPYLVQAPVDFVPLGYGPPSFIPVPLAAQQQQHQPRLHRYPGHMAVLR